MSSRSARILLTALLEVSPSLHDLQVAFVEKLLGCIDAEDLQYLPAPNGSLPVSGEPSLAKLKFAMVFGSCPLPSGFVAKWLSDFKGTTEELVEATGIIAKCTGFERSDAALQPVLERMILRNAKNACIIIGRLGLLALATAPFVGLLSSENDEVRAATIDALRQNTPDDSITALLVTAYTGIIVLLSILMLAL